MRLSTKGRYATRIMLYIAMHASERPVTKQEIGKAEHISPAYVEQILVALKGAGLARSHRGAKGGFSLAREAESISVADILEATEGTLSIVPCTTGECDRMPSCVASMVWRRASEALREIFAGTTLKDMAQDADTLQREHGMMFEI